MRRWLILLAAAANVNADCGDSGCPPMALPGPMTAARAEQIAPDVGTGLAVSTTHVFGDCRPIPREAPGTTSSCEHAVNPACARGRGPLRVLVVSVNQSIPIGPACDGDFVTGDLASRSSFDGAASEEGELVVSLDPGHYTVYVSADDRCAVCGFTESDGSCRVEVLNGRVTARDLVLDEATH